jgi:hypothetical protein
MFEDLYNPTVPTRHLQVDWDRYSKPREVRIVPEVSMADIWRSIYAQKKEGECLFDLMARLTRR